jgi:EKC/KEOPS complex subunit PCC1/LAGE3
MRALQVDAELSPLVKRTFSIASTRAASGPSLQSNGVEERHDASDEDSTVLRTEYRATTNRMLRVAVNGFMESLGVVLRVMEELDVDVLEAEAER